MKDSKLHFILLSMSAAGIMACSPAEKSTATPPPDNDSGSGTTQEIMINSVAFNVSDRYDFFTWDNAPKEFKYEKQAPTPFTNTNGDTHYYQLVYLPDGNLNWFQAAYLADSGGGYLASITSEQENDFIFAMVNDMKYFWKFPAYEEGKSQHNHYEITIGPFLGGYQPEGSAEPAGGWSWLSGEPWTYSNWAKNLNDGVIDKDPRPNDQPNDSGNGQRVMGFGEMNLPVPTWGDYMDDVGTYGRDRLPGRSYAFIVEYNQKPSE